MALLSNSIKIKYTSGFLGAIFPFHLSKNTSKTDREFPILYQSWRYLISFSALTTMLYGFYLLFLKIICDDTIFCYVYSFPNIIADGNEDKPREADK